MSKAKKIVLIVVSVILALLLITAAAAALIVNHYLDKIDYQPDDTVTGDYLAESELDDPDVIVIDPSEEIPSDYTVISSMEDGTVIAVPDDSPASEIDEADEEIKQVSSIKTMQSDKVINILLIGSDGRTPKERGRSDSMILVSINTATQKVYLTSILRDIYLDIPGVKKNNRINAAYSFGGAKLLLKTIEQNFRIHIDNYVQINFQAFRELVDYFGGVEITVSKAETREISGLDEGGTYLLNGAQALAYARIRHVGRADFERTERQRRVLNILIDKCREMSIAQLTDVLDIVLPLVATNMTKQELLSLLMSSPTYFGYEFTDQRIPVDHSWNYMTVRGMSVLKINFRKNINMLRDTVFEDALE